jgi:ABC-type amino acid transport substrate-binding protein
MTSITAALRRGLAAVLLVLPSLLAAAPADGDGATSLVVATKETPPFVVRDADGAYGGFAVELWSAIAERVGVETEWREYPLAGLIDAVAAGEADVGVGALTMTAERERRLDFTHPWLQAGFAIAVPIEGGSGWLAVAGRFLSIEFLSVLAGLILLLLGSGVVLWLAERRHNEQFGGDAAHGIGEGFWWAAVTMTTVGYGDRFPVTRLGRTVALIWMFAALIVISTFTAAITSALTVGELDSGVTDVSELGSTRVVTVTGSSSAAWLAERGIGHADRGDLEAALADVAAGRADALVYDEPLLRHRVAERWSSEVRVLPGSFARQEYAFVLAPDHPLREAVNRAILETLAEPRWQGRLSALSP